MDDKNMLKLNDNSTEFLIIGLKQLPMHVPGVTSLSVIEMFQQYHLIEILEQCWMTSQTWRTIFKALYMLLCNIAQTWWYLTEDAAATLAHSFGTSKLEHINALLYSLPDHVIDKPQCIQNNTVKIVSRKQKHDHVMLILTSVHWLPVQVRIENIKFCF